MSLCSTYHSARTRPSAKRRFSQGGGGLKKIVFAQVAAYRATRELRPTQLNNNTRQRTCTRATIIFCLVRRKVLDDSRIVSGPSQARQRQTKKRVNFNPFIFLFRLIFHYNILYECIVIIIIIILFANGEENNNKTGKKNITKRKVECYCEPTCVYRILHKRTRITCMCEKKG